MSYAALIGMLVCGIGVGVSEKILNSIGKPELANMINTAGLAGIGVSTVALITNLVVTLRKLGD